MFMRAHAHERVCECVRTCTCVCVCVCMCVCARARVHACTCVCIRMGTSHGGRRFYLMMRQNLISFYNFLQSYKPYCSYQNHQLPFKLRAAVCLQGQNCVKMYIVIYLSHFSFVLRKHQYIYYMK
jgi:hypothetical protein